MDRGTLIILSLTIVTAFALLATAAFMRPADEPPEQLAVWPGTDVACVPDPQALAGAASTTATLSVTFDGTEQTIPAGVGVREDCTALVHTLDETGRIHVRSELANEALTFGDFVAVSGVELDQEGFTLAASVNGEPVENPVENIEERPINDADTFVLAYTSAGTSTNATDTATSAAPAPTGGSSDRPEGQAQPLELELAPTDDGRGIEVVQ